MEGLKIVVDISKGILEVFVVKRLDTGYLVTEKKEDLENESKMFFVDDKCFVKSL